MSKVLAIDPGNIESAYCILRRDGLRPLAHGKVENRALEEMIHSGELAFDEVCIEMVASYGMPVGREVFDTCAEIGRLSFLFERMGFEPHGVYRKEVKLHLCGQARAKDSNIRMALIERFCKHDFKHGKGTKDKPDWFYQFRADEWSAYAVGVTYIESGGGTG